MLAVAKLKKPLNVALSVSRRWKLDALNPRRFVKVVLPRANLVHPETGEPLNFDRAFNAKLVRDTNRWIELGHKVWFPDGHSTDAMKNLGEWKHFSLTQDGQITGLVQVPDDDTAAKIGVTITDVSPDIRFNALSSTGEKFAAVIWHVAATPCPVVPGQPNFVRLSMAKPKGARGPSLVELASQLQKKLSAMTGNRKTAGVSKSGDARLDDAEENEDEEDAATGASVTSVDDGEGVGLDDAGDYDAANSDDEDEAGIDRSSDAGEGVAMGDTEGYPGDDGSDKSKATMPAGSKKGNVSLKGQAVQRGDAGQGFALDDDGDEDEESAPDGPVASTGSANGAEVSMDDAGDEDDDGPNDDADASQSGASGVAMDDSDGLTDGEQDDEDDQADTDVSSDADASGDVDSGAVSLDDAPDSGAGAGSDEEGDDALSDDPISPPPGKATPPGLKSGKQLKKPNAEKVVSKGKGAKPVGDDQRLSAKKLAATKTLKKIACAIGDLGDLGKDGMDPGGTVAKIVQLLGLPPDSDQGTIVEAVRAMVADEDEEEDEDMAGEGVAPASPAIAALSMKRQVTKLQLAQAHDRKVLSQLREENAKIRRASALRTVHAARELAADGIPIDKETCDTALSLMLNGKPKAGQRMLKLAVEKSQLATRVQREASGREDGAPTPREQKDILASLKDQRDMHLSLGTKCTIDTKAMCLVFPDRQDDE